MACINQTNTVTERLAKVREKVIPLLVEMPIIQLLKP